MWEILLTLGVHTLVTSQPNPLTLLREFPRRRPSSKFDQDIPSRTYALSIFIFIFLTCVWIAPYYSFLAHLGFLLPHIEVLATSPTYQCLTWMEPVILHFFLVRLIYLGTSNGLVGSSPLRVISSSSTSISIFLMRGGNF